MGKDRELPTPAKVSGGRAGEERNGGGGGIGRMAEMLLPYNFQTSAIVQSLKITGPSVTARILRVASLGFTSVALIFKYGGFTGSDTTCVGKGTKK
ncbi:hypothetical protein CMV_008119 [Castanea mollissima]|uniref:Uncharacterized protein n=1 Tax=Castanea mollissima TaxID=60419 RepID=A0A8J4RH67_9ROSI|nr:hypothetical protein CMV_008119 [Castanea mollissima]